MFYETRNVKQSNFRTAIHGRLIDMPKRLKIFFFLSLLISFGVIHEHANARDFGDLRFLWQGTYAKSANKDPRLRIYHTATYLPPVTLVFMRPRPPVIVDGRIFSHVITQHGQNLLVLENAISKRDIKTRVQNSLWKFPVCFP